MPSDADTPVPRWLLNIPPVWSEQEIEINPHLYDADDEGDGPMSDVDEGAPLEEENAELRAEVEGLRGELHGRLKALNWKAEEVRREWTRAENAESQNARMAALLRKTPYYVSETYCHHKEGGPKVTTCPVCALLAEIDGGGA